MSEDKDSGKSITASSSLTANVETLEAENYIIQNSNVLEKKVINKLNNKNKGISKKYSEQDLKEHTIVVNELFNVLDKSIKTIGEYESIEEGFLDKQEGLILIVLTLSMVILSPFILSGQIMTLTFISSLAIFFLSIMYKYHKYNKRKNRRKEIEEDFKINIKRMKYFLGRKHHVHTYIAISYNSKYKRTFNPHLYKMLRDELEANKRNEFKINVRVWKEFQEEIRRGFNQGEKNKPI